MQGVLKKTHIKYIWMDEHRL